MGVFDHFPYTNIHELNLSWLMKEVRDLKSTIEDFVSLNSLKYADPIQWNITTQYEQNTIVIDPQTGTAYISVNPVPAGVSLSNTDYWTVIFDLGNFVVKTAQNFTIRYEEETTTSATFATNKDEWLVWGDVLYVALSNIIAGDTYVIDSNIRHFTIEELYNATLQLITDNYDTLIAIIGDLDNLTTTDKSNLVAAINELVQALIDESNRVNDITGDPDNLTTTDKSNLVAAINENNTKINNFFNFEALNLVRKGFISGVTACQGGCYHKVRKELVVYADGDLFRVKNDGTIILSTTPGLSAHYNDMTINTKNEQLLICGGGQLSPAYAGLARYDYITLAYIDTILTDYTYYACAYDAYTNTYVCVAENGNAYVYNADTYEEITSFPIAFTIDGNVPIRQGGFANNGLFNLLVSPYGLENRIYTYDILTGSQLYISAYSYNNALEIEFADYTESGVVFGYLNSGKIELDYKSNVSHISEKITIYVDTSLSSNGFGTQEDPYNSLEFAARYAQNYSDVTVSIEADITGDAATFEGINSLTILGNNHTLNNNIDISGFSITIKNCNFNLQNLISNKKIRIENSIGFFYNCTFQNITPNWALAVSNNSKVHIADCYFNNCDVCIRSNWGSIVSFHMTGTNYGNGNTTGFRVETGSIINVAAGSFSNFATTPYLKVTQGLVVINGTVQP